MIEFVIFGLSLVVTLGVAPKIWHYVLTLVQKRLDRLADRPKPVALQWDIPLRTYLTAGILLTMAIFYATHTSLSHLHDVLSEQIAPDTWAQGDL